MVRPTECVIGIEPARLASFAILMSDFLFTGLLDGRSIVLLWSSPLRCLFYSERSYCKGVLFGFRRGQAALKRAS